MPDRKKVTYGLRCMCYGDVECKECPYARDGSGWHDCRSNCAKDVLALLKEQEVKTGHWIFESAYCEVWSHTCSECGKRMTTAYNTYANYCWNCGTPVKWD